jgi:hypothetical protein
MSNRKSSVKQPDNMSRKDKITHIRYLKKQFGNKAAMTFWVNQGTGISREVFDAT